MDVSINTDLHSKLHWCLNDTHKKSTLFSCLNVYHKFDNCAISQAQMGAIGYAHSLINRSIIEKFPRFCPPT